MLLNLSLKDQFGPLLLLDVLLVVLQLFCNDFSQVGLKHAQVWDKFAVYDERLPDACADCSETVL